MSTVSIPPQVFTWPTTFKSPVNIVSDGSTNPNLQIAGIVGDPLKKLIKFVDGLGNPIEDTGNDGGDSVYGDRRRAFRPGAVINADFATLTKSSDNVAANAAAIALGNGTTQGIIIAVGVGAPGSAFPITTGVPPNGSVYFRQDGGAGTRIYHVEAGVWTATAA